MIRQSHGIMILLLILATLGCEKEPLRYVDDLSEQPMSIALEGSGEAE